jgi:NADPH:quinone reductase-like Zn-dependent oxidoreductase
MDILENLGADILIDYTKQDYLKLDTRFDIFIEVAGKHCVAKHLNLLKSNGSYFLAFARFSDLLLKLWVSITSKKKLLIESSNQSKADLLQLKDLIEKGKFKPIIDKVFSLSETAEAHRYAETGKKIGDVVLSMAEE